MGRIETILSLARAQIGTAEQPPGSNNVVYNTDYYGSPVSGPQYPWCCAFIWWLFDKTGLGALFCGGEKTAYCPYVVSWARDHGQWVTGDYQPGDLLLYDWDGDGVADHIGVCERLVGQAAIAIEGNCGDAVQEATRSFVVIMGAYRPAWGDQSAGDVTDTDVGDIPETYTVRSGDMLGLIALRYGTTIRELARINHIQDADVIYPGQVLRLRELPQSPAATAPSEREPKKEEEITEKARAVIRGEYGNGLVRRLRLGRDYERVQAEVNRLLGK